ncbi:hypothetical protein COT68_02585 [bacterium (Candidatus Torokbacteria) CG09_land_8_20_14_0_10_42_11]|nr:MAG: hypothetical protein COT68_02585 [bacterium (Candidatus Torokbacteria) CG09_land_8_20_14_0_10_42_11]
MLKKIWPIIFLVLITCAFFYKVIFGGHVLVDMSALSDKLPWSAYLPKYFDHERPPYTSSDSSTVYYPTFKFYSEEWKKGIFPMWWPYLTGGYPILANSTSLILNPFSLLLFFLPPELGYSWSLICKIFLAGVGIFLYLRLLKIKSWASLVGALAYMFNTLVMLKLEIPWMTQAIWSLPFIFCSFEKFFRSKKIYWSLLAAFLLALQFVGGHPQTGLYAALFLFCYAAARFFYDRKKFSGQMKKIFFFAFLPFVLLPLLAAAQILPMFELQNLGQRSANEQPQWIPPQHLLTAIMPQFFGDTQESFNASEKIERNILRLLHLDFPPISLPYLGIIPLIFALVAIFKKWRDNFFARFFAFWTIALIGVHISTPLWAPLSLRLPFLQNMWNTYRVNILYIFSASILAGIGANYFIKNYSQAKKILRRVLKIIFFILIPVFLFGLLLALKFTKRLFFQAGSRIVSKFYLEKHNLPFDHYQDQMENWYKIYARHFHLLNPTLLAPLLLILTVSIILFLFYKKKISLSFLKISLLLTTIIDLFYIGWVYNPMPVKRADVFPVIPPVAFLQKDQGLYRVSSTDGWNVIFPNSLANYNISDIGVEYNIYSSRYDEYMSFIENNERANLDQQFHTSLWLERYDSPLLDLFNVKYIITPPEQKIGEEKFKLVYDREIKIYENKKVLPRVFLVPKARVIAEKEKILVALASENFNPLTEAIFEEAPPFSGGNNLQGSTSEILEYSSNQVKIKTDLTADGFLILADTDYPGWQVYVDGAKDKIYRANYLVRGLCLKAGKHEVVFKFEPKSVKMGLYISAITIIMIILIGTISILKNKNKKTAR